MKINGTIFSKPQQDQLRRAIESGGSGGSGGTTLNRYEVTLGELVGNVQNISLLHKILTQAKGNYTVYDYNHIKYYSAIDRIQVIDLESYTVNSDTIEFIRGSLFLSDGSIRNNYQIFVTSNGLNIRKLSSVPFIRVVYFNDTEITL